MIKRLWCALFHHGKFTVLRFYSNGTNRMKCQVCGLEYGEPSRAD